MTPFHCAAAVGNSNLLFQFLETFPECVEDVTVRNETALHLALKNDHTDAFNLLHGWLRKNHRRRGNGLERKVVNWRDDDDNTVLHIAATKQQHQAVQLLLDSFYGLDVKAKNSEGLTAREIIEDVGRQGLNMNSAEDDDATTADNNWVINWVINFASKLGLRTGHLHFSSSSSPPPLLLLFL